MNCFKKITFECKGVTLIELIISIAIMGIVMVSFLTMFSSGFNSIMNAGHRADAAYDSQTKMTKNLIDHEGIISSEPITYDFGDYQIDVAVDILESNVPVNGDEAVMKSFKPSP